MKHGGSSQSNW